MVKDTIQDKSYHPFVLIDLRILSIPLTTDAFRTYAELKRYANSQGMCFPSYTTLAQIFKGSYPDGHESTLKRKAMASVQELIEWGLLTKETRTHDSTSSPASNVYTLTDPSEWKTSVTTVSKASHKKKNNKPSALSEPTNLVHSVNQPSALSEPTPSALSALPSALGVTLTRSTYLDPIRTRSNRTRSREKAVFSEKPEIAEKPENQEMSPQREDHTQGKLNSVFENSERVEPESHSNGDAAKVKPFKHTTSDQKKLLDHSEQSASTHETKVSARENDSQIQNLFLEAYREHKPSNFVNHSKVSSKQWKAIAKLRKEYPQTALTLFADAFTYAREQSGDFWRVTSNFSMDNMLTNGKIPELADKHLHGMENDQAYCDRVEGRAPSKDLKRAKPDLDVTPQTQQRYEQAYTKAENKPNGAFYNIAYKK